MAFNPFKKKDEFVDLSAHYRKQEELKAKREEDKKVEDKDLRKSFYPSLGLNKPVEEKLKVEEPVAPIFEIFNSNNEPEKKETLSENNFVGTSQDNAAEKRKKLAKRLIDITKKMEDLTNQIYTLQQRIEVLERKSGVGY